MSADFEKALERKGAMTFKTSSLIANALYGPEPSPEIREEAYKAFTAWKADDKAAKRRQ